MSLQSLIDRPKELLKLIDNCLKPKKIEKKKYGEVFTPMSLVNEMLDKLDEYYIKENSKSIFEEKDFKWLDPANGMGNFPIAVYYRLMDKLKEQIPNDEERKKHILENMLYMSEFNKKNVFISKQIFDIENKYKLNLYCGDSLKLDTKKEWDVKEFDVVIGNPPYQPNSNNKKGGKSLWNQFVEYSLNKVLKNNGYLVFIHPALWRKPGNKLQKTIFSKQIHYLQIYNDNQGNKIFGGNASTRVDYYVLQNMKCYKKTKIHFEDNKIYDIKINNLPFIPNFGWSIFNKILIKLNKNGIETKNDSYCHSSRKYVSKQKDKIFKYKLLNSISKTKGKTYRYSSKPHKNQYKKKVLFSNGETIVPFYDDGKLGYTQGGIYILVNNKQEGNKIVEYLNSKLIKYLMKATKWSNFETCKQLFWYIANITDNLEIMTNKYIYKYFKINEDEIKIIENICK